MTRQLVAQCDNFHCTKDGAGPKSIRIFKDDELPHGWLEIRGEKNLTGQADGKPLMFCSMACLATRVVNSFSTVEDKSLLEHLAKAIGRTVGESAEVILSSYAKEVR